ncbi:MAG: DUF309 domain-containing protein [Armatimonadetes bacterium]|nr:DUF309 domain-containing protein [Armatimonadota bacterium]
MPRDWPPQLPPAFYQGLDELNAGDYYRCHETLESLWIPERRSVRELYQSVIQIAVGCYHLTARANWIGATRKLHEGARRLDRAGPGAGAYGVDWAGLVAQADRLRDHLRALGPERVGDFDRALLPLVRFDRPTRAARSSRLSPPC